MKELKTQNDITYFKLFRTIFVINAFTFGGGYTIIPIIKDKFVNDLHLIKEEEMINYISLASTVPGAMAISTSYLVGYKVKGYIGAVLSIMASVLPCLISISVITIMYNKFITNTHILSALKAISVMVSAILLVTVIKMMKKLKKSLMLLFPIIFILSYIYKVEIYKLLILSSIVGIIYNKYRGEK